MIVLTLYMLFSGAYGPTETEVPHFQPRSSLVAETDVAFTASGLVPLPAPSGVTWNSDFPKVFWEVPAGEDDDLPFDLTSVDSLSSMESQQLALDWETLDEFAARLCKCGEGRNHICCHTSFFGGK